MSAAFSTIEPKVASRTQKSMGATPVNAVILNGADAPASLADRAATLLERKLERRGVEVRHFILRDFAIGHCLGEFDCWVRHPGRCRIHDEGQEIERAVHGADLYALVTPVTFGGYGPELKKAVDRLIPLILPFFSRRAGLTHHQHRYHRYPTLLGIGVQETPDAAQAALFTALIENNAVNLGAPDWSGTVLGPDHASWDAVLDRELETLRKPGNPSGDAADTRAELERRLLPEAAGRFAPRPRVAILQASARATGTSTSQSIAEYLTALFAERGCEVGIVSATRFVRDPATAAEAARSLAEADVLVIASPLYVSMLPYLATRALADTAKVRKAHTAPQRLFGIVNCGFPEPEHTRYAFAILREYARETGATFAGGLSVGGGELIHGQSLGEARFAGRLRGALAAAAEALAAGSVVPAEVCLSLTRPVAPPAVYRFAGTMRWNALGRQRELTGDDLRARPFDLLTDSRWAEEAALGNRRARPLRVVGKEFEADDTISILFEDPSADPLVFTAGQYLTLEAEVGGETVRRSYSLASAPGDPGLAITVKRVPGGRMSNHLHDAVEVGDVLRSYGPAGHFTLGPPESASGRRILLVAGGSGIVPLATIARHLLASEPAAEVMLLYAARSRRSAIYTDALTELVARYPRRFSLIWATGEDGPDAVRRLDEAGCGDLLDTLEPASFERVMLCGPQGLRDTMRECLLRRGFPADAITEESFISPRAAEGSAKEQTATLLRADGTQRAIPVPPGRSLLDATLDAGEPVSFSCMSGSCGACTIAIAEGLENAALDEPNTLAPADMAVGRVLACITRLKGDLSFRVEAP